MCPEYLVVHELGHHTDRGGFYAKVPLAALLAARQLREAALSQAGLTPSIQVGKFCRASLKCLPTRLKSGKANVTKTEAWDFQKIRNEKVHQTKLRAKLDLQALAWASKQRQARDRQPKVQIQGKRHRTGSDQVGFYLNAIALSRARYCCTFNSLLVGRVYVKL